MFYYIRAGIYAYLLLVVLEFCIVRFMTDRVWKRVPPINEYFFDAFLLLHNLLYASLLPFLPYISGEGGIVIYRLTGRNIEEKPKASFKTNFYTILIFFAIFFGLLQIFSSLGRRHNSIADHPGPHQSYNNHNKNEEVVSSRTQALLIFLGLIFYSPSIIIYFAMDLSTVSNEDIAALDLSRMLAIDIICPLIVYVRNSKLRNHFVLRLRNLFSTGQ